MIAAVVLVYPSHIFGNCHMLSLIKGTPEQVSIAFLPRMDLLNRSDELFMLCTPRLNGRLEWNRMTDNTRQEAQLWVNFMTILDELANIKDCQSLCDVKIESRISEQAARADAASKTKGEFMWIWLGGVPIIGHEAFWFKRHWIMVYLCVMSEMPARTEN
jgi:hypothetical protein